jgi:hypothetical protein
VPKQATRPPRSSALKNIGVLSLLLVLVLLACARTVFADSAGSAVGGELQPIVIENPVPVDEPNLPLNVVIDGQRVSALPVYARVDAPAAHAASEPKVATVLSYRMRPEPAAIPPDTTWTATTLSTPGIEGANQAVLLLWGHVADRRSLPDKKRELAARQIAIWTYSAGFAITPTSVPDSSIRARALQLAREVAHAPEPHESQPISVSAAASLADVEPDHVLLSVVLSTNGENTFCEAQKLDIFYRGAWAVTRTGEVDALRRANAGTYTTVRGAKLSGVPCPKGQSFDFNEAQISLARPSTGSSVVIDWNIELGGPNLFIANNGAPALIDAEGPELQFRQVVALNPNSFPTAGNYLERAITNVLGYFHGIVAIIVFLLLLVIAPMISEAVRGAIKSCARRARRRLGGA